MSTTKTKDGYHVDRFTTFDLEITVASTLPEALDKMALKLSKISKECGQRIYNTSLHVEYDNSMYYIYCVYGLSIVHRRNDNGTATDNNTTE